MRRFATILSVGVLASALLMSVAVAADQPRLGTATNYAVMAATTITSTGLTVVNGNLAISPNGATSVTGFPPGVVTGTIDANNAAAIAAAVDLGIAYTDAATEPFTDNLTGQDLGGLILGPSVYRFDSSAQLTGTLILDGQGSTNPTFIFQIGSTLTTASASSVQLINGAGGCAVFWQVGSSATLGTTTAFQGTIMASASITATTGVTVGVGGGSNGGRLLALSAAVTLDSNVLVPVPTDTPTPAPTATAVPTAIPAVVLLVIPTPVPTDTPPPVVALFAIPTPVPSGNAATPASPAPSTVGPEMGLTTASPAPSVPNTSVSDQVSAPQYSITYLVAVGFVVIALSLTATLKRREISASAERADKA